MSSLFLPGGPPAIGAPGGGTGVLSLPSSILSVFGDTLGAEWEFYLADKNGNLLASLTSASGRRLRYELGLPAQLSFTVPADDEQLTLAHTDGYPLLNEGNRTVWGFRKEQGVWKERFVGVPWVIEDTGDEDVSWSNVTCFCPSQRLFHRLVRNTSGAATGFTNSQMTDLEGQPGTDQAWYLIDRTKTVSDDLMIDLATGTFETSTSQAIPFQEGSSVGQALVTLAETRTMDVWFEPVFGTPGTLVRAHFYTSQGEHQPGAIFAWDLEPRTARRVSRMKDMGQLANRLTYYPGRPGGSLSQTAVTSQSASSITAFGLYEAVRVLLEEPRTAYATDLQAQELAFRSVTRELVQVIPSPERSPIAFIDWFLGDWIQVSASSRLRAGFSGEQRVQGFTLSVEDDGFEVVEEIRCTPQ